jgi:hypothetical protein
MKSGFKPFFKDTPGYNYKYAPLPNVMEAIEESIANNGFILVQTTETVPGTYDTTAELTYDTKEIKKSGTSVVYGNGLDKKITRKPLSALVTTLLHISGMMITSSFVFPVSDDPQEVGSTFTYYRRYSILGLLSLVADEDDDGASAKVKPINASPWSR